MFIDRSPTGTSTIPLAVFLLLSERPALAQIAPTTVGRIIVTSMFVDANGQIPSSEAPQIALLTTLLQMVLYSMASMVDCNGDHQLNDMGNYFLADQTLPGISLMAFDVNAGPLGLTSPSTASPLGPGPFDSCNNGNGCGSTIYLNSEFADANYDPGTSCDTSGTLHQPMTFRYPKGGFETATSDQTGILACEDGPSVLVHELAHAYAMANGNLALESYMQLTMGTPEVYAMTIENIFRRNTGRPELIQYARDSLPAFAAAPCCDHTLAPSGHYEIACDGVCIDPTNDSNHCGSCANVCNSEQACVSSQCACVDPALTACTECFDTSPASCKYCANVHASDPSNCGGCGYTCWTGFPGTDVLMGVDYGTTCIAGICTCNSSSLGMADGVCTDLGSDPANCGSAGHVCPHVDDICRLGTCVTCPSGTFCGNTATCCALDSCTANGTCCPSGMAPCGNNCVDLGTDSANCGGCGIACTEPETCLHGHCFDCGAQSGPCDLCANTGPCDECAGYIASCPLVQGGGHCTSAQSCASGACDTLITNTCLCFRDQDCPSGRCNFDAPAGTYQFNAGTCD